MGAGQPWRTHSSDFEWTEKYSRALRKKVGESITNKPAPTLLLVGPSGHGKSAFINSVSTVSKDNKSNITNSAKSTSHVTSAPGGAGISVVFERKFRKYILQGQLDAFNIADTEGIQCIQKDASHFVDSIVKIINGHIKSGTEFTETGFQTNGKSWIITPEESDKVHCVIIILKMTMFADLINISFKDSIQNLLTKLNTLDVPRIVILTHADKMDKDVNNDITNMFCSDKIKGIVNIINDMFGVPIENIHPIVNYADTRNAHLDYRLHIPILLALESALTFADDTLHKRKYQEKTDI